MKNIRQFLLGIMFLLSAIPIATLAYTGQYPWDPIYVSPTLQTQNSQTEQRLKSQYGISAFYGCYACTYTDTSDPNVEARCLNAAESCLEKKAMTSETQCSSGFVYLNGRCITIDNGCKEQYGAGSFYRGVKDSDGKYSCDCSSGYEWNSAGTACDKVVTTVTTPTSPVTMVADTTNILEGAIIKTADNPDVYIVKYNNNKKFKRLILSPSVFRSYGHLKWENIMTVSQETINAFITSDLVKVAGDPNTYKLYPNGDTGEKKLLMDVAEYWTGKVTLDYDSVYEINSFDRDSYVIGAVLR